MENFIQWLKEETLAGIWSKGVQLSRASKGIELLSGGPGQSEWKFKIQTTERTLAYQVTLWPEAEDAHCNCDSKIEPCHHIVAVALAWQTGIVSKSEERTGTRLRYHWVVSGNQIALKRELITRTETGDESAQPLSSSLVALIGGIQSGRIKMPIPPSTPLDLKVDELCSQRDLSWKELLKTLRDLAPLRVSGLDGVTELTIRKPSPGPILEIKDTPDGISISAIDSDSNPSRILRGNLAIWGSELGYRDGSTTNFQTERVSSSQIDAWTLTQLPSLRENYEVRIETQKIPEVIHVEPVIDWKMQTLDNDTLAVTPFISYGPVPAGKVAKKDLKREQELMKDLRTRHQMGVLQTSKLDSLQAFEFRESVQHPVLNQFLTNTLQELQGISLETALTQKNAILRLLSMKKHKQNAGATRAFAESIQEAIAGKENRPPTPTFESLPVQVSRALWDQLRDYQKNGVKWLADHFNKRSGAILADDMGLGKTVQTLAVLEGPSLVVVPTSLLDNWFKEAARFRPDLKVHLYHGSSRQWNKTADVILTTYGLLRQEPSRFLNQHWSSVVLDEAHIIRNADTQAALVAFRLQSDHRLALTGTPIQNRARDLWSLFQFLSPDLFPSEESLKREWISPFILRRTKSEVLTELPPKTYLEHSIELSTAEREFYQAVWAAAKSVILQKLDAQEHNPLTLFEVLLRSRQICDHQGLVDPEAWNGSSSKLDTLFELITSLTEAGHSILVYSQWTKYLDRIEKELEARSSKPSSAPIEWLRLDGSTRNRGEVLEKFQSSLTPKVFLLSLHAGGVGLNLTNASHVIFCDPWWNPYVELQAEDRAYRMGQKKPVTIHRLLCRDSIEEKIRSLQAEKKRLEKDYLDLDQATASATLSMGDLEKLLSQ